MKLKRKSLCIYTPKNKLYEFFTGNSYHYVVAVKENGDRWTIRGTLWSNHPWVKFRDRGADADELQALYTVDRIPNQESEMEELIVQHKDLMATISENMK